MQIASFQLKYIMMRSSESYRSSENAVNISHTLSLSLCPACRYTTVMGSAGDPDSSECHVMVQHLSSSGLEGQSSLLDSLRCHHSNLLNMSECTLSTSLIAHTPLLSSLLYTILHYLFTCTNNSL